MQFCEFIQLFNSSAGARTYHTFRFYFFFENYQDFSEMVNNVELLNNLSEMQLERLCSYRQVNNR